MKTAILLYEEMTLLDAVGPYEVLASFPGNEVLFVAEEAGEVRPDTRAIGLVADRGVADVESTDILLIPGGVDRRARENPRLLDWIRKIDEKSTWTTSVCTGSLVLGAAGLLKGVRATTHWARLDKLADFGAEAVQERVVHDGKYVTAAGVSSGIDMALTLMAKIAGEEVAQAIQLAIEYDPDPPFDSGLTHKTPRSFRPKRCA